MAKLSLVQNSCPTTSNLALFFTAIHRHLTRLLSLPFNLPLPPRNLLQPFNLLLNLNRNQQPNLNRNQPNLLLNLNRNQPPNQPPNLNRNQPNLLLNLNRNQPLNQIPNQPRNQRDGLLAFNEQILKANHSPPNLHRNLHSLNHSWHNLSLLQFKSQWR
jgi:hypothetical protein